MDSPAGSGSSDAPFWAGSVAVALVVRAEEVGSSKHIKTLPKGAGLCGQKAILKQPRTSGSDSVYADHPSLADYCWNNIIRSPVWSRLSTPFGLPKLEKLLQKDRFSWQRMQRLAADWLPQPRILHPYPDKRFAVMHPRQEPCAGNALSAGPLVGTAW
jgi:hypothetical protein